MSQIQARHVVSVFVCVCVIWAGVSHTLSVCMWSASSELIYKVGMVEAKTLHRKHILIDPGVL